MTMKKLLVVGAGMTGSAAACLASRASNAVAVSVWDKGGGAGGRMSTTRGAKDGTVTVDLGAQYFTSNEDSRTRHQEVYKELVDGGLLVPMVAVISGQKDADTPGIKHFVSPSGSSSLPKHFLKSSGAKIDYKRRITDIALSDCKEKWVVKTEDGTSGEFECVALTMPVPQILQLFDSSSPSVGALLTKEVRDKLESVEYSSRYALGLFFDGKDSDKVRLEDGGGAAAKYITDDPVFRFASLDGAKRGNKTSSGASVVLHTSAGYGKDHVERTTDEMRPEMEEHLKRAFPSWPQPAQLKCHKWRYSQVSSSPFTSGAVVLSSRPLLVMGGDAFAGKSGLDACLDSAKAVAKAVEGN